MFIIHYSRKVFLLKAYIDSVLDVVGAAQESDGYLYTARTINPQQLAEAGAVAMRNDYIQLGNLYQKKKVENMGRFITTMYINDLTFVNFSDAQAQNVPNINILFPYGAYLQNEQMMQLEVYVAKKYLYMQKPSELYRK